MRIESKRHQWVDRTVVATTKRPAGVTHSDRLPRRGVPARPLSLTLVALYLLLYGLLGHGWGIFALLLLTPDLAAVALLAGPRWGIHAYNAAHRAPAPAMLAGLGFLAGLPILSTLGLIWLTHIAIDWTFGYGLFVPPPLDSVSGAIGAVSPSHVR